MNLEEKSEALDRLSTVQVGLDHINEQFYTGHTSLLPLAKGTVWEERLEAIYQEVLNLKKEIKTQQKNIINGSENA